MKLSSLRVGLRLARRELRARPARAALVILLIVVPTAAMTVVTTFFRTSETSADAIHAANLGSADYRAYFSGNPDARFYSYNQPTDADIEALRQSVPAGTQFLVEKSATDRVRGADFVEGFTVTDVDLTDPLVRGRYTLVDGRAPRTAEEGVVNQELADALRLRIGSTMRPERLGVSVRVVGIMQAGQGYELYLVTRAPLPPRASTTVFIGATAVRPQAQGWSLSFDDQTNLSHTDRVLWTYVGGAIGMFALGTIVAAAFALGARRQLRTIGLLSASGAPPRVLAWALTAQGAFAGLVGAVVGILLGVIGVRLMPLSLLQSITARHATSAVTRPADLIPIALLGVAAAMGAAAFPARSAARLAVLQALASRRPVNRARRGAWFAAVGILAIGAVVLGWTVRSYDARQSTVATLVIVVASVLPFVSALLAAPLVVARLERWASAMPLVWRLAGRSLARNRARSASVVGATCAVVGLAIAGATLARSWAPDIDPTSSLGSAVYRHAYLQPNQALLIRSFSIEPDANGNIRDAALLPPDLPVPDDLVARVHALIPDALRIDLMDFRASNGYRPNYRLDVSSESFSQTMFGPTPLVTVASRQLLDLFDVSAAMQTRLAAGDALVIRSPGAPKIEHNDGRDGDGATVLHVGGSVDSRDAGLGLPRALISAERAAALGWHTVPAGATAFVAPHDFTAAERKQLELFNKDIFWEREIADPPAPGAFYEQVGLNIGDDPGPAVSPLALHALGLAAVSLVVLAIAGLGLGLSARDNQDETAVLDAVGAPPRVRRQVGTRRALLLVVVATVIAVPAGIVPVAAVVIGAAHDDQHFQLDWLALAAALIGLPLVVAGVSAAGGWLRDRIRGPRPDVLAFGD